PPLLPATQLLADGIDPDSVPAHIAIIMDGNGRWAQARGLPRVVGHKAGVDSVREAVRVCGELGVDALTLYAFSTENWLRPAEEVRELMRLLCWALRNEVRELNQNGVRLKVSGRISGLPSEVQKQLTDSIEELKGNRGLL